MSIEVPDIALSPEQCAEIYHRQLKEALARQPSDEQRAALRSEIKQLRRAFGDAAEGHRNIAIILASGLLQLDVFAGMKPTDR